MSRLGFALAVAVLLAAPASVRADDSTATTSVTEAKRAPFETDRDFYIEINGGKFIPSIDRGTGLRGEPYKDIFGVKKMWVFGFEFDYEIWSGFGTVSAGLAVDYAAVYGHGIVAHTGDPAPDITSLNTLPIRALAVYRFDWLARRYGIPLIPFGKVGLAHTLWWITNGTGSVANFDDGTKGLGGKWGYELSGGLALELNFIDPWLAREFDQEFGVNSVAVHAAYSRVTGDNFGKGGLDLTTNSWVFGLGFEF